jgi:hypothetical protein
MEGVVKKHEAWYCCWVLLRPLLELGTKPVKPKPLPRLLLAPSGGFFSTWASVVAPSFLHTRSLSTFLTEIPLGMCSTEHGPRPVALTALSRLGHQPGSPAEFPSGTDCTIANYLEKVLSCVCQKIHATSHTTMAMAALILALFVVGTAAEGPCDILGAAGNPCVAAHSTVRALYAAYDGPLYNVRECAYDCIYAFRCA